MRDDATKESKSYTEWASELDRMEKERHEALMADLRDQQAHRALVDTLNAKSVADFAAAQERAAKYEAFIREHVTLERQAFERIATALERLVDLRVER